MGVEPHPILIFIGELDLFIFQRVIDDYFSCSLTFLKYGLEEHLLFEIKVIVQKYRTWLL